MPENLHIPSIPKFNNISKRENIIGNKFITSVYYV